MITTTPRPPVSDPALPVAVEKPRPPVHTTILPIALVALDIEVREKYTLSDDLETICAIAGKTASAVLIASAGHPRQQRESAFAIWRKQGLATLRNICPDVIEFLSTHAELSAEFHAGTIDLFALDTAMHESKAGKERLRMERLAQQKEGLRAALNANCEGMPPGASPTVLVVRGDGSMKMLKNHQQGKEWGRLGNTGFYLIPLATADMRRFLPAE